MLVARCQSLRYIRGLNLSNGDYGEGTMGKAFALSILSLSVVLLSASAPARSEQRQVAIRCGQLIDGRGGPPASNVLILIEGETIKAVGAGLKIPDGAEVIDLSRFTVLPGLIDAHTHLLLEPGDYDRQLLRDSLPLRTLRAGVRAREMLEAGFTSIRDLETEGAGYADVALRQAIDSGLIPGPRMQTATRALSSTGNYQLLGYAPEVAVPAGAEIVDGVDQIRRAVREQIKHGADWIKFYADYRNFSPEGEITDLRLTFSPEEMKAIVEEAHRRNRRVAAHAYSSQAAQAAIAAGVDSLEHGMFFDERTLRLMAERGVYWCPTLYAYYFDLEEKPLSPHWRKIVESHREVFKAALRLGVKIALGSDAGSFPHAKAYRELELMAENGMTNEQAIRAATVVAAELLGWQDRVGTIEPGKYADIIAVNGSPLADIKAFRNVAFVMKGGKVFVHEK